MQVCISCLPPAAAECWLQLLHHWCLMCITYNCMRCKLKNQNVIALSVKETKQDKKQTFRATVTVEHRSESVLGSLVEHELHSMLCSLACDVVVLLKL